MSNEYTITLTVREIDGGVSVMATGKLGAADCAASVVAHALCAAIKREAAHVKAVAEESSHEASKPTTIH